VSPRAVDGRARLASGSPFFTRTGICSADAGRAGDGQAGPAGRCTDADIDRCNGLIASFNTALFEYDRQRREQELLFNGYIGELNL
jgi:hypothetical protein